MSTPILTFGLDTLTTGVLPGVNEDSVPLWIEVRDVIMDGSGLRPSPGYDVVKIYSGMFDDAATGMLFDAAPGLFDEMENARSVVSFDYNPVTGVHQQRLRTGEPLIVWGNNYALWGFDGMNSFTATRLSAAYSGWDIAAEDIPTTRWSFAQWGDWVLATNGRDKPQMLKFPTTQRFLDIPNFPADTAEIVRVLGPHALFFNLSGLYTPTGLATDQNQFVWCKQDNIEEWNPLTAGNATAGELTIRDLAGPIRAVEPLGQSLVVYGENDAHILSYGGDFLFTTQRGVRGVKAVSKNSIAAVGNVHYGLTEFGIFMTDGLTFQPKAFPRLGNWLERNVDWKRRSRIVALVDPGRNCVKWMLPLADGSQTVLVYHYATDSIGFELQPFNAACPPGMLPFPIIGDASGYLWALYDQPFERQPLLITKPLAVGNREGFAYLDALMVRWTGAPATVSARFSEHQDGIPLEEWTVLGTVTQKENVLHIMREAVFAQFKIESEGEETWYLSGLDIYGKKAGRRL